jgi:hypothetical protein
MPTKFWGISALPKQGHASAKSGPTDFSSTSNSRTGTSNFLLRHKPKKNIYKYLLVLVTDPSRASRREHENHRLYARPSTFTCVQPVRSYRRAAACMNYPHPAINKASQASNLRRTMRRFSNHFLFFFRFTSKLFRRVLVPHRTRYITTPPDVHSNTDAATRELKVCAAHAASVKIRSPSGPPHKKKTMNWSFTTRDKKKCKDDEIVITVSSIREEKRSFKRSGDEVTFFFVNTYTNYSWW